MHCSRRDFLKNIGLLSLATPLAGCSHLKNFFEDPEIMMDRVVIIGGGLAGLSLAYELKKEKIPFYLFEAGSRWGGRIHTLEQFGPSQSKVELGAEWIDTSDQNVIELVSQLNLKIENDRIIDGSYQLIDVLKGRVFSPLSGFNYSNEHALKEMENIDGINYITFKTSKNKERFIMAKKVVLAMPPHLVRKVKGLEGLFHADNVIVQNKIKQIYEVQLAKKSKAPFQLNYGSAEFYSKKANLGKDAYIYSGLSWGEKEWVENQLIQNPLLAKEKPKMNSYLAHNWQLKPWAQGSHFKLIDKDRILKQLPPRLYLAGDAYSDSSSMNGALQSVKEVLKYF